MLNDKHVVLLVDDDPITIGFLDHYFSRIEWVTRTANSVIDALPKLDQDVDLVITDYDMPTLNGCDMRQMVRQTHPNIRVLGMSGFNFSDRDMITRMFDAFLQKPFRVSDLKAKVAQILLSSQLEEDALAVAVEAI